MKILNFGSINIDYVYTVDHFVRPGETLGSLHYQCFSGGKGLNQSIALAHAGGHVYHAGRIGTDGYWLNDLLRHHGVETAFIQTIDVPSGHAIIQVNSVGENAIIIHGGANRCIVASEVERIVRHFSRGDYLLVQNEINSVPEIIRSAKRQGMTVAFNPAPMTRQIATYPLNLVDLFILNETEAHELTNETDPDKIRLAICEQYPQARTVLTMGRKGALYFDPEKSVHQPAESVKAIDTTAAGDTFIGFFLAEFMETGDEKKALQWGCRAAALCVTRSGAADSIPEKGELDLSV